MPPKKDSKKAATVAYLMIGGAGRFGDPKEHCRFQPEVHCVNPQARERVIVRGMADVG